MSEGIEPANASYLPPSYDEKDKASREGSLEKGVIADYVVQADSHHHFDAADLDRVQRRLKQRHVQMIAVSHGTLNFLGCSRNSRPCGMLCIDCWDPGNRSFSRVRRSFARCRSARSAHCIRSRRDYGICVSVCGGRNDLSCAHFRELPALRCTVGGSCARFRCRVWFLLAEYGRGFMTKCLGSCFVQLELLLHQCYLGSCRDQRCWYLVDVLGQRCKLCELHNTIVFIQIYLLADRQGIKQRIQQLSVYVYVLLIFSVYDGLENQNSSSR